MSKRVAKKWDRAVAACSHQGPDDRAHCYDKLAKSIKRSAKTERERKLAYELEDRAQAHWRKERTRRRYR